jgi:CRP/FNR family transcriptional regulator, cyclic AMP receptor protein
MPTAAEILAQVPFFALLDDNERGVLAERVELVHFAAGETVFAYGDPGDSMYVLTSGAVELSVKTKTGEKVVLETPREGDFFGEISLLDAGARTATAVATADTEAIEVDRGDLDELFRLKPAAALDLLSATGRRLRQTALLLRNAATRNVNEEVDDHRTRIMKVADWISDFSGSIPFLFIHVAIFFVWIILNLGLFSFGNFDPFPFGLLTMVVSLEAIILSVFVLLSQNRQVERERVRSDIEYDINLKAELQIQHLHEKFDKLNEQMLSRLARIEKVVCPPVAAAKG